MAIIAVPPFLTLCITAGEFDDPPLDVFEKAGKVGFRDVGSGKVVIPARYDDADLFFEGRAAVALGDKWGYINSKGDWVVRPRFDYADNHFEGLAVVGVEGKNGAIQFGAVDRSGKLVIPTRLASLSDFRGRLAVVSFDGKAYGLMNQKGEIVVKPAFNKIGAFRDDRAPFLRGGSWGVIDGRGTEIAAPIYDETGFYADGRLAVRKGDKWGYLDRDGKLVIACRYDFAGLFRNNRASVSMDKKKTYFSIDTLGERVSR